MRDLNPHGRPLDPKSSASANSANRAYIIYQYDWKKGIRDSFLKQMVTPSGIEPELPPWKGDVLTAWPWGHINRRGPTFPGSFPPSIIGAEELNYCVRDGNRCILFAILTGFCSSFHLIVSLLFACSSVTYISTRLPHSLTRLTLKRKSFTIIYRFAHPICVNKLLVALLPF